MTRDDVERLRRVFADRATLEPSVSCLAVVGSWAREAAHDGSDLDLVASTDRLDR